MTTLQIVLLSIAGVFTLVSIVFMLLFIAEISVSQEEDEEEAEVKSVFSSEEYKKEENVDEMLEKLDKEAEEPAEEAQAEETTENAENAEEAKAEETAENAENAEEAKAEEKAENAEEAQAEETAENAEEVKEETAETTEEAAETPAEETAENVEQAAEATPEGTEVVVVETVSDANLLDYKARLAKVIENRDKIDRDLIKVEKSILNYERTKRRKIRNQKMLDRRASELTNLNLVMYSVTDIKNVDEDKKVKQEELTSHIAELKASIQDADEFLDSNKEKNDHDVKMAKFLIQEKTRLNEEIAEIEDLIAKTEGTATDNGDANADADAEA